MASREGAAVARGVGLALAVAAPAALLAQLLDAVGDGGGGWWSSPLAVVVLAGVASGGWAVGATGVERPVVRGAVAGLLAIAVVQLLGVVRRSVAGDDVAWATVPGVTLLAVALAAGAAALAVRRAGRTRP